MKKTYYRCTACKVDLPLSEFHMIPNKNGRSYRRSICRRCTYLLYGKYVKKRVPIEPIRGFIVELVHLCGSERAAATRLGIARQQLRSWLGKQPRYHRGRPTIQRNMSRESAALVLTTLREVRRGQ